MDCLESRSHWSADYDGELAAAESDALEAHLGSCPPCRSARDEYGAGLDRVGPVLHRLVDRELPARPFPEPAGPGVLGWWRQPLRYAALALAAVGGLTIGLKIASRLDADPERAVPVPARVAAGGEVREEGCPWRRASPADLARTVSYPVVADECLDQEFELVEASVTRGHRCSENVRLTYRAGARRLFLEQHPDPTPTACPHGDPVLVGETAGCFERLARGMASLRWNHRDLAFHLTGDLGQGEAVLVARNIAANQEE